MKGSTRQLKNETHGKNITTLKNKLKFNDILNVSLKTKNYLGHHHLNKKQNIK